MPTHFAADGCAMPSAPRPANDDRAADLIAAYEAGAAGDLSRLGEIDDREDGSAVLIGFGACALSGAAVGFGLGVLAGWAL